ncbi:MAG: enoyl-CoA hydratase [Rhodobiaceae bacterium]|nr:enoyl-CoA hydratase [Rhodobiaceae bacterium]MCC0047834.1 enoyl-CoA hydratase [Rhodobiaceae bacterium]
MATSSPHGAHDMSEAPILVTDDGPVRILTLNRPKARNTLTVGMMTALEKAFADIARTPAVRCVVIRAEGPGFCAGHDLKEMQAHRNDADRGKAFFTDLFTQCTRLMGLIRACERPVIAEVQGIATAAGCQLVATCDIAVASSNARFGVNGIDVGFFCSTPAVALARNIDRKKAMELLLTGRMMSAEEACDAGLVNHVADAEELAATTMGIATTIAGKSTAVAALGKKAFYEQVQMPLGKAYELASQAMVENLLLADAEEGFTAFIDKRPPEWQDK